MNARMNAAIERSTINLIRMSTRLADDTRVRLVVPLRTVATATIAEIIAAKAVA